MLLGILLSKLRRGFRYNTQPELRQDVEPEDERIAAFVRGGIDYKSKCKRYARSNPGEAVPCLCCIGPCWG